MTVNGKGGHHAILLDFFFFFFVFFFALLCCGKEIMVSREVNVGPTVDIISYTWPYSTMAYDEFNDDKSSDIVMGISIDAKCSVRKHFF